MIQAIALLLLTFSTTVAAYADSTTIVVLGRILGIFTG